MVAGLLFGPTIDDRVLLDLQLFYSINFGSGGGVSRCCSCWLTYRPTNRIVRMKTGLGDQGRWLQRWRDEFLLLSACWVQPMLSCSPPGCPRVDASYSDRKY